MLLDLSFNVKLKETIFQIFKRFKNFFFKSDVTQSFEGTNLTISGWGYTASKGQLSPNLKFAFVNGWNNTACKATGYGNIITDNMICASTPKIDTDACQGDSGG